MSTTPPTTQTYSRPIDIAGSPSSIAISATSPPSSALSASLKAFSDLSLSNKPVRLEDEEFKQAFHHARRASFGTSASSTSRPVILNDDVSNASATHSRSIPTLSTSPGSNTSDLSSLPTPSSSPLSSPSAGTSSTLANPPPASSTTANKRTASGGSTNGKSQAVSVLGGVCEKDEILMENGQLDFDDLPSEGPPAPHHHHSRSFSSSAEGSSLFGGGARWGWPAPSSSSSGTNSPPMMGQPRRGSYGALTSPPNGPSNLPLPAPSNSILSTSPSSATTAKASPPLLPTTDPFARMQPLGRVVSAGAALQTPKDGTGSGEGFGLFRRFSIGGFGSKKRVSPPSPPSLALPPHSSTSTDFAQPGSSHSTMASSAPSANVETRPRGRSLVGSGQSPVIGKTKRKISPMGEKFLRGGY